MLEAIDVTTVTLTLLDSPLWQCLHCMISTTELYLGCRVCPNFHAVKMHPNKIPCGKVGMAL